MNKAHPELAQLRENALEAIRLQEMEKKRAENEASRFYRCKIPC
jgi:hypothetical protein